MDNINKNEKLIKEKYKELGFSVLRGGCSDFLIYKYDKENKKFIDVHFKEVKFDKDKLKPEQKLFIKIMNSLGIPSDIEYIKMNRKDVRRRKYNCLFCNWKWFSKQKMLSGKEPKVCPRCHQDWRKKRKFITQVNNIKNFKNYKCLFCGWEWFTSESMLKGKEPKVCTKCHQDWRKKRTLIIKVKGGKKKNE